MKEITLKLKQGGKGKVFYSSQVTKKERNQTIVSLRKRIRAEVKKRTEPNLIPPDPPPRYDEIFFKGTAWLDELEFPARKKRGEL
jgi:hypothetical protein